MRATGRLEPRLRGLAVRAALAVALSTLVSLTLLVVVWRGQIREIRREMDDYVRGEGLAVGRTLLYDLASDPRVLKVHLIERSLLNEAPETDKDAVPPPPELLELVRANVELPDTLIWYRALQLGMAVSLSQVEDAREAVYEKSLRETARGIEEDLWARVTFSDHLRGVRLVSSGGLVVLQAGEEVPPDIHPPAGRATLDLSRERLLVVLPLYVQTRRWGTAFLLMDRGVLGRVTTEITWTLNGGLLILGLLLLLLLGSWVLWWGSLMKALRRDVVAPVVALARRMEGWARDEKPVEQPDVGEPEWLGQAFDGLLVRMEEQKEQLLTAQRLGLMERIGAGLSHELNNALNPARLRLEEMALEGRTPTREDLNKLREYLKAAQAILRDLSMAGRRSLGPSGRLRPGDWLSVARRLLEPHFEGGPRLEWEVSEESPVLTGDQQALIQVAMNLMLNARDAAAQRGEEGTVRVSLAEEPGGVVLKVEDNGPGIPEAVAGHLFEPFVTSKETGTGLGLFVVDALLRRMGASIRLEPREGGGTRAVALFPRRPADEEDGHGP
ncbi:MAG: HAMP domain-containing sensor histidine kinase [Acidobacteriota bacterium]